MARANRTRGFRVSASKQISTTATLDLTSKKRRRRSPAAARPFKGMEELESRLMLTVTPSIIGGVLTCTGTTGQANTISVSLTNNGDSMVATVDGVSTTVDASDVNAIMINAGSRSDSIKVSSQIKVEETLTEGHGAAPSSTATGNPTTSTGNSGQSSGGSSNSSSGTSTSGSGSSSSTGSTGSSSSGSSGSGSSSSGSSSSGSSSSGSGSTGSSSTGSGSTGSSSSGSTSSGSTSSGSTSSGSTSSGSGSSSTGSTGTGSTGTGTTSTGSSGSGANATPTPPPSGSHGSTSDGTNALISFTTPQSFYQGLAVQVNGLSSKLGSGSSIQATYSWNFGDTGSQYNTLVGFNAAHVYDNPGTYTVTLSLTDANGQTSVATGNVTVLSNSSLTTIYVSPNGNDDNSGTSPDSPIQSVAHLNDIISSNERILFEDGGTYDVATGLGVSNISNVEIGSYGSGAQPILMYDGPSGVFGGIINIGASNVSVRGLTFDSIYADNFDRQAIHSAFVLTGNNITVRDNTFLNVLDDLDMSGQPNNVLVQNNTSPSTTDLNAYFAWIQGNNIELLGNTAPNSVGEAIVRIGGANNVLIADNNFANIAGAGGDTNDISKNVLSIQDGSYAYVYGNILSTGPVSAGPLGTPAADSTASFTNVVFDSNKILNSTILLTPGVHNAMARNNLIESDGDAGITISAQEISGAFNWQVQNVYIEHNTVTEPSVWGGLLSINDGEAQGVHITNNLFVDPNYATGAGAGFIKSDNDDMDSFAQIADNVWSIPASVAKFAQGGYFFISSDVSSQSGWLTPAEWEATGIPTGDVYENVTFGSTFSTSVDGFTAGSSLPND